MKEKSKRYLITDSIGAVMVWSAPDEQCCYVNGKSLPARTYTKGEAQSHIRKTKANRKKWGYKVGQYSIMLLKEV